MSRRVGAGARQWPPIPGLEDQEGILSRASRSRRSASRRARDVAPRTGDFSGSFAQQALLWLVALKLLGVIVVFSTVVQFGFDLPKSLWSKALEWPMAAILAIALLRYGTAIVPRTRLHVLVAAFVAANVVAAVFAPDTYVALFGLPNRYLGLTYVADMAVLYLGLAVAGALIVAALGALASPPGQRLLSARTSDRVLLYETTLRAFAARPLFGWGPDGLGVAWPQFRGMHDESVWQQPFLAIDQAHNWLLQTAVTTGAVGFLALSATIAAVSWTLSRSRAPPGGPPSAVPLASYITYWLGALTSVESVSVSWIPWAVTGAAVSLTGTRVAATAPAVRRLPAAA